MGKMKFNILIMLGILIFLSACNSGSNKNNNTEDKKAKTSKNMDNLEQTIANITKGFNTIPDKRAVKLEEISNYIEKSLSRNDTVNLVFICTHNSRRSHMAQIWAQKAADHYSIPKIVCFSGGTEATAFNPRAVRAMEKAGFSIEKTDTTGNPVYLVTYSEGKMPLHTFSKKFDDPFNPQASFAAIMVCSDADEACPFVPGAESRFAIPYEDPKVADNTSKEEAKYDERSRQIATEMFYLFSRVKR